MSVLLETSLGDIVIDLETELCPKSCINFIKLCQKHCYKFNAFFSVTKDFLAQTGDPSNSGKGGESVWSQLPSESKSSSPYFKPDINRNLKHTKKGTVSFACTATGSAANGTEELIAGSQFFITLKDDIEYLDDKHAPFGTVVEGQEPGGTLDKINEAFVDEQQRPLRDIRIRHVVVLEDPFPDPDGFTAPSRSPSPTVEQAKALRLADNEDIEENRDEAEIEEAKRKADSSAAALTLEMVGDLPFAEIRPPENILFVCKLNPVTRAEDLELIFSRFGKILSCEVIRDKKSGDSLQYAFIEFDRKEDAERAYFKMQNVMVDDRRIWVDFSQSVSKLHGDWVKKRNQGREAPKGHYKWDDRDLKRGDDRRSGGDMNMDRRDYGRPRGENRDYGSHWESRPPRDATRRDDRERERDRDRDRYRDNGGYSRSDRDRRDRPYRDDSRSDRDRDRNRDDRRVSSSSKEGRDDRYRPRSKSPRRDEPSSRSDSHHRVSHHRR